jgi:transposase-like protein
MVQSSYEESYEALLSPRCPDCNTQMIREEYPNPEQEGIQVYKFLCCACGYTRLRDRNE